MRHTGILSRNGKSCAVPALDSPRTLPNEMSMFRFDTELKSRKRLAGVSEICRSFFNQHPKPERIFQCHRIRRTRVGKMILRAQQIGDNSPVSHFHIEKIPSFDAPELEPYRTLRRSAEHAARGIFVAEGDKVVRRLLESDFGVISIVLSENRLDEFHPLLKTRADKFNENFFVYLADKKTLETLVGFEMFQGVLAVGKIPRALTLADLLAQNLSPKLFAAVDSLANAENVGVLTRNCAAFGAQGLIVGPASTSPFLRRAVRNSMGAIFQLPVVELGGASVPASRIPKLSVGSRGRSPHQSLTLTQAISYLRSHGIHVIAAHPHTDKRNLAQADFTRDCCLVFGSEGKGISPEVLAACDEAVAIPMSRNIDSLNVSAAAAVFLYEANRQRGKNSQG